MVMLGVSCKPHRADRKGDKRKIQNEIYVSAGNRTSDPWLSILTPSPLGLRDSCVAAFKTFAIQ